MRTGGTTTRFIVVLASALIVGACGTRVSFDEARKLGEQYFRSLEAGDVEAAMQFYSAEFLAADFGPKWESFLRHKKQTFGECNQYSLLTERFAPRVDNQNPGTSDVCFVLDYMVSYAAANAQETLTMCPKPSERVLRIVGHELQREGDAANRLTAGRTFQERGVNFGNEQGTTRP